MTVNNQSNRTSAVGTATVGQVIPFSFPINDTTDLVVKTRVTATGVESDPLVETTDYTVSITGDKGGNVTLVAALAATSEAHVIRDTPNTQETDLEQGGAFNAENVEDALDKNTKLTIELKDAETRTLRAPATDATSIDMELPNSKDRKGQFLAFTDDDDAEPTVVDEVAPATATITAFSKTYLDDANAAAVRNTIGVAIGTNVQAWDAQLDDLAALSVTDDNIIEADGSNWTAINKKISFAALADEIMTNIAGEVMVNRAGNVLTRTLSV